MWNKDPIVEQLLTSLGMKFEFKIGIKLDQLLIEESKRNNARFGKPLDEGACQLYAFKMQKGEKFPAPVLTKDLFILGGNNRIQAARMANRTTVDAYIVAEATPQQTDEFIRGDNIRHGKALTEDEKILSCVEFHRKYKTPMRELNDTFFGGDPRTYDKIMVFNRAKDVEEKLQAKAVDVSKLPMSTLAILYPINDNINILRDAGLLAAEHILSADQVALMIKEIKEKPTESERLGVIGQWRVTLTQKVKTGKNPPETNFRREISRFLKFLKTGFDNNEPFQAIDSFVPDKGSRKELKEQVTEIINQLKRLKQN